MEQHTLVLSAVKTVLPESISSDFVSALINRGLTQVEYFGREIDNHCDIISHDMEAASRDLTFIDIHFDTEDPIGYEGLDGLQVETLALNMLKECRAEIRRDEKDITIYL
ncbi:hypothetical protein [Flavobacterium sp.]|uniref:hypothetical protein n=1 Tax=Flavobacterium sp. TaxID=239 RepID=UPI0031CF04AC